MKKYKELYKNVGDVLLSPFTKGISVKLVNTYCTDTEDTFQMFLKENLTSFVMDYELERRERFISKPMELYYNYLKDSGQSESDTISYIETKFANVIYNELFLNWKRIFTALFSDYNPIENYRMIENEETDGDTKRETDLSVSGSNSESTSNERKFNGFNTDSPKVVESSNGSSSGSNSQSTLGSEEKNVDTIHNERELTRSGNIGVTTSQQMIESEINLRKHKIMNIIFNDIDKLLFLSYIG